MQASVAGSYNSVGEYMDGGGSRRASHSGEHFILTPDAVGTGAGMDARTTLMIRNIPNKYTQKILMQTIDGQGFYGKYDFFYLPIDFKNRCNVGYAFINMASTDVRTPLHVCLCTWAVLSSGLLPYFTFSVIKQYLCTLIKYTASTCGCAVVLLCKSRCLWVV